MWFVAFYDGKIDHFITLNAMPELFYSDDSVLLDGVTDVDKRAQLEDLLATSVLDTQIRFDETQFRITGVDRQGKLIQSWLNYLGIFQKSAHVTKNKC